MMRREDFQASKSLQLACGERLEASNKTSACELDCVCLLGGRYTGLLTLLLCFSELGCVPLHGQREQGGFCGADSKQWHWRTM